MAGTFGGDCLVMGCDSLLVAIFCNVAVMV